LLLECLDDVSDAKPAEVPGAVPLEHALRDAEILSVRPRDGVEYHRAILDRAAERAEPVLRERERHHASAGHAPEGRPQPRRATDARRTEDRAARLGADAEADEPRGRGRGRARGGTARAFRDIPW